MSGHTEVRRSAALLACFAYTELRASARVPEFAVGVIGVPALLYAMFGMPNDSMMAGDVSYRTVALVSLSAYGVISLAIFTFGEGVANDRDRGWTRTLLATPIPLSTYLASKVVRALVQAVAIVSAVSVLAVVAGVRLPVTTWLAFYAVMAAGVVAFSTLGLAIALIVRPRAAAAIANLIFLPLAFASGFFVPLSELPAGMRAIAPWLPSFHFGQLAHRVVAPPETVVDLTGIDTRPLVVHGVWVLAATVAFGAVAMAAARRDAITRRT